MRESYILEIRGAPWRVERYLLQLFSLFPSRSALLQRLHAAISENLVRAKDSAPKNSPATATASLHGMFRFLLAIRNWTSAHLLLRAPAKAALSSRKRGSY